MTNDLLLLLVIAFIAAGFWWQSKQSEIAKRAIERRCERVNVQIISIARNKHKLIKTPHGWQLITRYQFEFSANGLDCHQGFLDMKGRQIKEIFMPAYPM